MKKIVKFLALSRSDRYLLILTFLWMSRIRVWLWRLPFQQVQQKLIEANQRPKRYPFQPFPSVAKIVWAVQVCHRYLPGKVKCLAQALTTQIIASHLGYSLDLQIGVAKGSNAQLEAHAWVTDQGQVAIGSVPHLKVFVPIWSISGGTQ